MSASVNKNANTPENTQASETVHYQYVTKVLLKGFGPEDEEILIEGPVTHTPPSTAPGFSSNFKNTLTRRLKDLKISDEKAPNTLTVYAEKSYGADNSGDAESKLKLISYKGAHITVSAPHGLVYNPHAHGSSTASTIKDVKRKFPNEDFGPSFSVPAEMIKGFILGQLQDDKTPPKTIGAQIDRHVSARIKDQMTSIETAKREAEEQASRARNLRDIQERAAKNINVIPMKSPAAETKAPEAVKPQIVIQAPPLKTVRIPVTSLNSKPVHDFAKYMTQKFRATALRAFTEFPELKFSVSVNQKNPDNNFFEINFDINSENIDANQIHVAELLLTKLRIHWEQGKKINLENARKFIETTLGEIKELHTTKALGDGISVVFASKAIQDTIALAPPTVKAPEKGTTITTSKPRELNLAEAGGYVGRGFQNPINFNLAPWHEDEAGKLYFSHINEIGEEKRITPTENQLRYVAAMRDPDVKVILLQAPPGAGKTMLGTRISLEMLKMGVINQLYYERPTETVGGNYNPYLSGSMDDKFGPFARVLEDEIATQLGGGNVETGKELFKKLNHKNKITRYDQMYQRGDTLRHAFLLGDEMQNKTYVELYHMMTRVGEGSKVILIGDYEDQNDLEYGRKSGFQEAFETFENVEFATEVIKDLRKLGYTAIDPKTVTTLRFSAEDIKRDPHVAFVYMMNRKRKEMAMKEQGLGKFAAAAQGQPKPYTPPDPKLRYTQHREERPAPQDGPEFGTP